MSYNRANRQVAILCNHQRAVPKTHEQSMQNLEIKVIFKKNCNFNMFLDQRKKERIQSDQRGVGKNKGYKK